MAVALLLAIPAWHQWQRQRQQGSLVSFIEVGHGNATVLEMPGNRVILVDGGGPSTLRTDIGQQLLAPFLRQRRIRRLEAVVISHPHADHYNGLAFILRHFQPRTLWINGHAGNGAEYRQLLAQAEELGIEIRVPVAGEVLAAGNGFSLRSLADFHRQQPAALDPNDQSLVLGYQHKDKNFLLPGDISMEREMELVNRLGEESAHQVLAASHHGRATSMAPEFVAAVEPRYIIISDNDRQIDSRRVANWQNTGARVLSTGERGSLACTVEEQRLDCRPLVKP
ncbi:MAG: MBL fold metallo-hydrolase [Desulfurivibrio sp.]|nr:MBL fold metallo-hydrolase [Desulfurivibrio sp.]